MGLVPILWLLALYGLGQRRDAAWWWVAAAFAVSWLADSIALGLRSHSPAGTGAALVSAIYPVSQAAFIGAVVLTRPAAQQFLLVLTVAACIGLWLRQVPDVFLHTVAWLGIVAIVWNAPLGSLRSVLLVAFGFGWLAWLGFVVWQDWTTWKVFQAVRAVSLGWFCWAALEVRSSHVRPALR